MFPTRPRFYAGRPPTDPSEFPPLSSSLSAPRSAEQAERYFRRVAKDNILPSRAHRWLSLGGWILGGGRSWSCGRFGRRKEVEGDEFSLCMDYYVLLYVIMPFPLQTLLRPLRSLNSCKHVYGSLR